MDRYIGLDAHSSSCTVAVVGPSGRRLQSQVLETNAKVLIDFQKTIPGSLYLCLAPQPHPGRDCRRHPTPHSNLNRLAANAPNASANPARAPIAGSAAVSPRSSSINRCIPCMAHPVGRHRDSICIERGTISIGHQHPPSAAIRIVDCRVW